MINEVALVPAFQFGWKTFLEGDGVKLGKGILLCGKSGILHNSY